MRKSSFSAVFVAVRCLNSSNARRLNSHNTTHIAPIANTIMKTQIPKVSVFARSQAAANGTGPIRGRQAPRVKSKDMPIELKSAITPQTARLRAKDFIALPRHIAPAI